MSDKPGRNAPCPCGSGKKYKKCCGVNVSSAAEKLFAPMPDDVKTGSKCDFYFDIFRAVMIEAETLKKHPKFGGELRRVGHDFEERFKLGIEKHQGVGLAVTILIPLVIELISYLYAGTPIIWIFS